MSIPADIATLMQIYKPKINKFTVGDIVIPKEDQLKRKRTITAIYPDGTYGAESADYGTVFISTQGKLVHRDYQQYELEITEL